MKITPWSTHPQAILGGYDFLLLDKYNQSYINNHPDTPKLYNCSARKPSIHYKRTPHGSGGVNKGLLKQSDALV